MNSRFAKICIKAQEQKWPIFSVKLFNFSVIFAPVPLCKFLQIWSSFLSTLLCSKYLQSNFKVPGPLWSLSWKLSFTVLHESHFKKKTLTLIIIIYTTKLQFARISKTEKMWFSEFFWHKIETFPIFFIVLDFFTNWNFVWEIIVVKSRFFVKPTFM